MRRPLVAGAVLLVAVAAVMGAAALWSQPAMSGGPGATSTAAAIPAQTAKVERRTLQASADLAATLGYEGEQRVLSGVSGTLTRLPAVGATITQGQALYEVDGKVRPRLLYGTRPAWRALGPGIANGADILQLERDLKAMGDAPRGMKVDQHWDRLTTKAVKHWQKRAGLPVDGTLDASDVAFLPCPVRVTELPAPLGTALSAGTEVLRGTSTRQVVTLDLAADQRDLLPAGQAVTVDLPGGTTAQGTVRSVGRVATAGQGGGSATLPVAIELADASAVRDLDAAPVTVHVATDRREGVLAVPVTALLARLEGGYALEVVGADGARRYEPVELGLFEDGWVEVRGSGIAAGDTVVTAR